MFAKLLLREKKVAVVFLTIYSEENIHSLFTHAKFKVNFMQSFLSLLGIIAFNQLLNVTGAEKMILFHSRNFNLFIVTKKHRDLSQQNLYLFSQ